MNTTYSAIKQLEQKLDLDQERLTRDFMTAIQDRMSELQMNQSDIAYALGKSRAYISKIFTKNQNMTVRTMVELATTLDLDMRLSLAVPEREQHYAPNVMHLHYAAAAAPVVRAHAIPNYWEQSCEEEPTALEA